MSRYGLTKAFPPWTPEEDELIRLHAPKYKYLQQLLVRRTYAAVKTRARKLCLGSSVRSWEPWEDNILRDHYPNYDAIVQRLKQRSREGVRARINRLNIHVARRTWSKSDLAIINTLHLQGVPKKEIAKRFHDVTTTSIFNAIYTYGDSRARTPRESSQVMSSICARMKRLGIMRSHYDKANNTSFYFSGGGKIVIPKLVIRAIEDLGGTFQIEWDEK
ncbi:MULTISPECIES: hypothetical protein [Asticcacaulis]|uniref:hypothetical protein n=1 Tax=Asticcacaulis TaxID=76890 RepID=UPI001AE7E24C|nr:MULTISPECIES: hypothetical protein [Asticcacaulis]MBP2159571.1 hypothetical protein [Asticcacaulis solisilvae]MDR6800602.1 hypothetical protein [Asticcacaulis sp. BE141]